MKKNRYLKKIVVIFLLLGCILPVQAQEERNVYYKKLEIKKEQNGKIEIGGGPAFISIQSNPRTKSNRKKILYI